MSKLLIVLILFLVVVLTGLLAFLFTDKIKKHSRYVNTFSASVVAALIFVHVLPEVYEVRTFWVGFTLLSGMIFQLFLEKVTKGIEHGHVHSHAKNHKSILIGLLIGLGIHSFVEGTPIFIDGNKGQHVHAHDHHDHGTEEADSESSASRKLFTAIALHKVPVTIVLALFLVSIGVQKWRFFSIITLFALMTPLGGLLGNWLSDYGGFYTYSTYFVAFSTGMLMHIITAILFEHSHSKKESNMHILIISIGVTLGAVLFY